MTDTFKSIEQGLEEAIAHAQKRKTLTIHEIDVVNMVRVVNGVDQLAAQRAALGI